eukprot:scaffold45162_cov24-Prasinocladus_malaysianus.AAC.1
MLRGMTKCTRATPPRLCHVLNCEKICRYLESHPLVKRVNYPGSRRDNPKGYEIQRRQVGLTQRSPLRVTLAPGRHHA